MANLIFYLIRGGIIFLFFLTFCCNGYIFFNAYVLFLDVVIKKTGIKVIKIKKGWLNETDISTVQQEEGE